MSKPFSVNLWGSDPLLENDDCWGGDEFETLEAARAFYADPWGPAGVTHSLGCTEYIELDGPGVYEIRRNPGFRPTGADTLWANEIRMQAAMMGDF